MKRSEINKHIEEAIAFMDKINFKLPPWGYWPAEEFIQKYDESYSEIVENALGWDLTDFGSENFQQQGLILFTLRNGNLHKPSKSYAEKIMIVEENQITPMHHHKHKTEDIINRGGGKLVIELYPTTKKNAADKQTFTISVDGVVKNFRPGDKLVLSPGESVCLTPEIFHRFYGEPGKGKVLVGEVSSVNDDNSDNVFFEEIPRFPDIVEDEPIHYLLSNDYKTYL